MYFYISVAPFNPKFEFDHAGTHLFVGGHMGSITCSPNDPVFWLHHSFVDCTWEEFRRTSQRTNRETDYPPNDDNEYDSAHNANREMVPFGPLRNIDGMSDRYVYFKDYINILMKS